MPTTVELSRTPLRDPSALTYGDLTGGAEPKAVFEYEGIWLIHFTQDLTEAQQHSVLVRAEGNQTEDDLRGDVLEAAPSIQAIMNSTGTLTAAQLSDAVRALAKATWALGKLVLEGKASGR